MNRTIESTRPHLEPGESVYAINYVFAGRTSTLAVVAHDSDEAYELCRSSLVERRYFSASLQGKCRPATTADIVSSD